MLEADFDTHFINGYARAAIEKGENGRFACPLISHITGNLYVGGCRDSVSLGDEFDYVFSMYKWERYEFADTTEFVEIEMYDSNDVMDAEALDEIAEKAFRAVQSGKTLIHCQAGLNRSNLIATLVLRKLGYSSRTAIDLLRDKRSPVVLCNAAFEEFLLGLDEPVASEVE